MSRRPVTATWWLLTDADGVRYLRCVPRDPERPMKSSYWRDPNPWDFRHRERVRFGAWEVKPSSWTGARFRLSAWTMPGGTRLECVHPRGHCAPGPCVIHNPLSTRMDSWRLIWRADRGIFERICPDHGVGHPAPEQEHHLGEWGMVHGCCGCCMEALR